MEPASVSPFAAWSSAAVTLGSTVEPRQPLNSATLTGSAGPGKASGTGAHCGSSAEPRDISRSAGRASATLRVSGPCTDICWLLRMHWGALALYDGMRPTVLRSPTTPQAQAG